jgi:hypothetical protein
MGDVARSTCSSIENYNVTIQFLPNTCGAKSLFLSLFLFNFLSNFALAHHGWSSFDETAPIYLQGTVKSVKWQNPHAELMLEVDGAPMPAGIKSIAIPAQSAAVDAAAIMAKAAPPKKARNPWEIEFAPLSRMEAWQVAPIKVGEKISVVGYTFKGESGEATLRVEYLFRDGKAYALRSAPVK